MIVELHNYISKNIKCYRKWHKYKYHPHVHWGIFGTFSLLTLITVLIIVFTLNTVLNTSLTYAATQSWASQADWSNWTMNQTSNTVQPGSLTLSANLGWSTSTVDSTGTVGSYTSLDAIDSNTIYISYYDQTNLKLKFAKTVNGGTNWVTSTIDSAQDSGSYSYHALKAIDANTIFVAYYYTDSSTISAVKLAKSTNGGSTWATSTIDSIAPISGSISAVSLAATDSNTVLISYNRFVLGSPSHYYLYFAKSTNGGGSWVTSNIATNADYNQTSISAVNSNTIFIGYYDNVAKTAVVRYSTNGGSSWASVTVDSGGDVGAYMSIFALDANNIFAVYNDDTNFVSKFAKSTNGGSSWTKSNLDDRGNYSIYALDANTVYISRSSSSGGGVLKISSSTNGGSSWSHSTVDSGAKGSYNSIKSIDASNIFISYYSGSASYDLKFAKYGILTYQTPGYASINFDGTNTYNQWQTLAKTETLNGQTISYYVKTSSNTSCTNAGGVWTGWTSLSFSSGSADLTALSHTRYLCLGTNLSTTDTSVTPQVNSLILTYRQDPPPIVAITSPTSNSSYSTDQSTITLAGTASDTVGTVVSVSSVSATVTGTNSWTTSAITLNQGSNSITLTATDDLGQTGTASISITYSPTTPTPPTPPIIPPTTCDLTHPTIQDCGDAVWGTLKISTPNGGECFLVGVGNTIPGCNTTTTGTTTNITWVYTPYTYQADHIKLQYSVDGSNWTDIISSVPISPASYTWTLPTDLKSTTVKVKGIAEDSNNITTATDSSDADFSIHANSVPGVEVR